MLIDALKGSLISLLTSLFVAILFAYVFRLPIPMGGYIGPFSEFPTYNANPVKLIKTVFIAWAFYGIFGGFIILAIGGAITGIVVGRKYAGAEPTSKYKKFLLWSTLWASLPVFILSILDTIIGPW